MTFTEEDVPLMKLIFNPTTHDMGMLVGGERAEEIFEYVCEEIEWDKEYLINDTSHFYKIILSNDKLCYFFWTNGILNLYLLDGWDIYRTLTNSPISEKIWDSNKLKLSTLDMYDVYWILNQSPIAKKIWDSGKLNVSKLDKDKLEYLKQKFESQ